MNSFPYLFFLKHSILFEFQKDNPKEVAREWTIRAQEVDAGLCQRQS